MKDRQSTQLSRRTALGMLGAGGLGLVSVARGGGPLEAWSIQAPAGTGRAPRIPQGAIIRTILKDLPPAGLGNGAVLFHEHMSFDSSFFEKMRPANAPRPATPPPRSYLENVEVVIDEVRATGKEGVSCIVDGGHPDMGTSYPNLKTIAERSGVHIVASGGYYLQTTYPPEVATKSEDQLVDDIPVARASAAQHVQPVAEGEQPQARMDAAQPHPHGGRPVLDSPDDIEQSSDFVMTVLHRHGARN